MKKYAFLAALLPLMFSCSQEEGMENAPSTLTQEVINKVTVTVSPLNERSETRTALTQDGNNKTVFVWASSDNIGIFPDQGNQVGFSMAGGAGSTSAEFNGGGWGLKASSTYAAYYPLIKEFELDKTAIPMSYTGQKQVGNGTTAHLGAYDFLSAPASNPQNGTVNFAFGHLGTLLHFKFTVPEAAELTSIILKTNGELTEKATLNLTTNQVTATATGEKQTLLLENVSVAANEVLDAYMMIAAVNLAGKTLEATVTSAAGDAYVADLTAQDFVGGDVWNYTRTLAKDAGNTYLGHAYVDLGITDSNGNKVLWATTNVGADNPWEYGGYYAWGETKAYGEEDTSNLHNYSYMGNTTYKKTYYSWDTYKWATGSDWNSISKYSRADGQKQGWWYDNDGNYIGLPQDGNKAHTILAPDDDAATVNWGNGWRMPTYSELDALRTKCYWVWVTCYKGNAVKGYVVYAAKCEVDKGYNGPSPRESYSESTDTHIFLPAAGYRISVDLNFSGDGGYYWSSELYDYSYIAHYLCSYSGNVYWSNSTRCIGRSVRPVLKVKN